jgi:glycosyltransferase involved in cell wall biosynthesis
MPLRIAHVAPLWARIPPETYGGTERIVHCLTEELARRGHEVTLFATEDAQTSARLRPVRPYCLFDGYNNEEFFSHEYCHIASLAEALSDSDSFDLVHAHLGGLSIPFSALARVPLVHTLPSLLNPDDLWMLERYPEAVVVARSHRQVSVVPEPRRKTIRVIYNGCDFSRYTVREGPGKYLAFLGRMAKEKNPAGTIRVGKKLGMPVVLAGEPYSDEEEEYFEAEIRPLIDGRQVRWVGGVNDREKNELFGDAAAFVFPLQWEEPFGIVLIEAMACGAPVVALNRGSVSEVVEQGKTGYSGETEEELPALVEAAMKLDRKAVREHAARRFSADVMTDAYEKMYNSLLSDMLGVR